MDSYHRIPFVSCLVEQVVEWLQIKIKRITNEVVQIVIDHLSNSLEWRRSIQEGIECGAQAALTALRACKDAVVDFCLQNRVLIEKLTKIAAKSAMGIAVVEFGAKGAARFGIKQVAKQGFKTALKTASPVGLVADIAQGGLEATGHEKEGKIVGMLGNIGSGAIAGFMIAGPPGIAIGALMGFGVWGIGEVIGGTVNRLLPSENCDTHAE